METNKIMVRNPHPFAVGIYKAGGQVGVNIPAGSAIPMTVEDVEWISSTSTMFDSGYLIVDKQNQDVLLGLGIDQSKNPNIITDDEIRAELKKTARNIDKWLSTITEGHVMDKIAGIALEMDLAKSKLDVVSKYVNLELKADME